MADGAGSARHAAAGSREAACAAARFLVDLLSQSFHGDESSLQSALLACLQHARTALEKSAKADGNYADREGLTQYATTLLVVCVTDSLIGALQLGDGAIVLRRGAGDLFLMFDLVRGEYINEAHFLTSPDFAECARCRVIASESIDAIAMLTDGIEILALEYADASPYAPFFEPMFSFASAQATTDVELDEFLRSDRVCERSDDDKTLLLAIRR